MPLFNAHYTIFSCMLKHCQRCIKILHANMIGTYLNELTESLCLETRKSKIKHQPSGVKQRFD